MRLLPVKLFFIKKTKKFKKVVQNMSKRWSKTMPVRTPNPVFRESFFKFWNSHTNQVLKTPISSGRVTQLISAPWKVITSRRRRREGGRRSEDWAHQRQGASRKNHSHLTAIQYLKLICLTAVRRTAIFAANAKANVNQANEEGRTPLYYAADDSLYPAADHQCSRLGRSMGPNRR